MHFPSAKDKIDTSFLATQFFLADYTQRYRFGRDGKVWNLPIFWENIFLQNKYKYSNNGLRVI